MALTAEHVLQVLTDPLLNRMRFSVGPINVNAKEYDDVADFVKVGAIRVRPWDKSYSQYVARADLLQTKKASPPMDLNSRTNLLHECTHAITDMRKVRVTRLEDEAAAYLAQITYLMLIDPNSEQPPIGLSPLGAMTRLAMQLVDKYKLVEPEGFGATISPDDIVALARLVHAIPDYSNIGEKEKLNVDGIDLDDDQTRTMMGINTAKAMAELDALEEHGRLTTKVRYSAHENYVTGDGELRTLFKQYEKSSEPARVVLLQKLRHIFLTIDQPAARRLAARLSVRVRGDVVSELFQSAFPKELRDVLLGALAIER